MLYTLLFTVLGIFLGEFLIFSFFNSVTNYIGGFILLFGCFLIIFINKHKKVNLNYFMPFALSLILAIFSPFILIYMPFCGGYDAFYYAALSILISVFWCIPYFFLVLKSIKAFKKYFWFIMLPGCACLIIVPHLICMKLFFLI